MLTIKHVLAIHRALHARVKTVTLEEKTHEFQVGNAGGWKYNYIIWQGYKWLMQNPTKGTKYAKRALAGERITWGIPEDNPNNTWALIEGKIGEERSNYHLLKLK